jgi:hypothetical protein
MQWLKSIWTPSEHLAATVPLPIERWDREHYLPFRPNELLDSLANLEQQTAKTSQDAEVAQSAQRVEKLRQQVALLKQAIHIQYQTHHEFLTDLYARFDPDCDISEYSSIAANTVVNANSSKHNKRIVNETSCRDLFAEIGSSLHHANYRRLSPREIQAAVYAATHWGVRLKIQFSSFRRLEVYARGDIVTRRLRRNWRKLFRKCEVEVPIYQRLVVVFRTKEVQSFSDPLDPACVHLRMFKNIPKADIDMMLPGSQIRLTWLDTGKIGIPTLWGVVLMSSKLAKSIWIVALLGTMKMLSSAMFAVAITVATIFYGIKSALSYSTTKRRYQLNITRSLYYQNLDNNLGALLRLEEEAEQQEVCEAMIAYFILARSIEPLSTEALDRQAEVMLKSLLGFDVDFDVQDAIRDLASIGQIKFDGLGWKLAR